MSMEDSALQAGHGLQDILYSQREEIARRLDDESGILDSWRDLAREMDIDLNMVAKIDYTSNTGRPTEVLFKHLKFTQPNLPLASFTEAARKAGREDIARYIDEDVVGKTKVSIEYPMFNIAEKDLASIEHLVSNCGGMPETGWLGIAENLGLSHVIDALEYENTRVKRDYSPTMELLRILEARYPNHALRKLRVALIAINRNDVLEILDRH